MSKGSLHELEAVLAVASHKSFRAAARALETSPSALSHAVAALEERLGARLFHRTTRSVALTPAGTELVARIGPALREIDTAFDAVDELNPTPRGSLRLTSSPFGAKHHVLPFLVAMRRLHPEVQIELVTDERLVDLVAEGFDAGFRLAEAVPADMVAIPCAPDLSMAVVATPVYLARHGTPEKPADLLAHECIRRRLASGGVYRWELERRGRVTAVDVKGSLTLDDDDLVLDATLAGAGLGFVSSLQAEPHVAARRLVRVLAPWTPPFAGPCLFHPSGRLVPAALRALIDIVKAKRKR